MTTPKHLREYTGPSSYAGATWYGYFPVVGCSRDSDCVEASNFAIACRALLPLDTPRVDDGANGADGYSEHEQTVVVTECSHWAVGWVKTLYVHRDNLAAVKLADELRGRIEDYPVLDEDDVSAREWEQTTQFWRGMSVRGRIDTIREARSNASVFSARREDFPRDDDGRLLDYCRE